MTEDQIMLAQIEELENRIRSLEHPVDLVIQGVKYPALPLAPVQVFLAWRMRVLDQKIPVLARLGEFERAEAARGYRAQLHRAWSALAAR